MAQRRATEGGSWHNGGNIGTPDEEIARALRSYLATAEGPDGQPTFVMRRAGDVDALLCRWVIDGDDALRELAAAIASVEQRAEAGGDEMSPQWKRQTARRLQQDDALEARLVAYVEAYWEEERSLYGFDNEDATLPPEDDGWVFGTGEESAESEVAASRSSGSRGSGAEAVRTVGFADPAAVEITRLRAEVARLRAELGRVAGPPDQMEVRLDEEVSRAYRGLGGLSVLLVELLEDKPAAAARSIDDSLRQYDTLCVLGSRQFGIILPGADAVACQAVEGRIRLQLSDLGGAALAIGAAQWPDDGSDARALLEHAGRQLVAERGDAMPDLPQAEAESTSVWFEGWPRGLEGAHLARSREGMRLRVPLSFLREGSAVLVARETGARLKGTVRRASVGPHTSNKTPILQLDLDRGKASDG